jgi:hypothetical protein
MCIEMKLTNQQLRQMIVEEHQAALSESKFAATAEEEAKKINAQTGISLRTDQAYWEESGISTGEDLALSLLSQNYSDTYKSIHGIRPRWRSFESVEEVQEALNNLDQEVEEMIAADELIQQQQVEYEKKRKEMRALMPTGYEHALTRDFPKRAGFGRSRRSRMPSIPRSSDPAAYGYTRESAGRLTSTVLREMIAESIARELSNHSNDRMDNSLTDLDKEL